VSQENIDLARRVFDAFSQRDLDALLELADPELEFLAPTAELAGQKKPYRGLEGMRKYFEDVASIWQELEVIPHEFRDRGDQVVALGRVYARGRDGLVVDAPAGWVWKMRGGKVVWGRVYTSREEALNAVGLRD
jgi:ketosteroid isomerase-like protein